ncbi:hypothetical protein [Sorangium atrum]|uniref:SMB domain-containing protein n=1 Tax=Sorangium atrum TaxID=2995308 RepID=A0ABT5BZR6_9BACT|nr:hypothetical protein [Sorangium aterium]MDC0679655.1 hypothetical protein [Sorangium aterium]
MLIRNTCAVVLASLLGFGCAVDAGDTGDLDEDRVELDGAADEGAVGSDAEALAVGAPRRRASFSQHYGGNIVEEDHYPEFGGMCAPGYERVRVDVSWNGNGACEFAGWVNPGNPADCRARLHVHTNAFWGGGTCTATSFEARSNLYTCAGRTRNYCGGAGPQDAGGGPVCFCDNLCTVSGDCCPDYQQVCR